MVFPGRVMHQPDAATQWWIEAASAEGIDLTVVADDAITLTAGSSVAEVIGAGGRIERIEAARFDFALLRGYMPEISMWLESCGVTVLNPWQAMERSRNKWLTHLLLEEHGIPSISTRFNVAGEYGGVYPGPIVIKPAEGSQGRGVRLLESEKELTCCPGCIAQPFMESSRGRDLRVWVVDGHAVAAVERIGTGGDFRSNHSLGGSARLIAPVPEEASDLAVRATAATGLFFAGVDLLYAPGGGYAVCEVNGNAGFRTLASCAGPDLPRSVMKAVAAMLDNKYRRAVELIDGSYAAFHKVGAKAYDPGLGTPRMVDELLGSPSRRFRSIHIAGTNGKGSTAHTIAAVMQSAGYRTGLFTSPHLLDMRERIRVDGRMMSRDAVSRFMERWEAVKGDLSLSFFELTTAMAFDYFARMGVDIAVIETGLGGRLDSTNIITPELSVITNISLDHTAILGDTPEAIAAEKAGIIKPGVPVVIGEASGGVRKVFEDKASALGSPCFFAEEVDPITRVDENAEGRPVYTTGRFGVVGGELTGECQRLNAATVLTALGVMADRGWRVTPEAVAAGMADVTGLTGLHGRWEVMCRKPLVVTDTGHNPGGWRHTVRRLARYRGVKCLLLGFMADKDIREIFGMLRGLDGVSLYVTSPEGERAMQPDKLAQLAIECGLSVYGVYASVSEGMKKALAEMGEGDMLLAGGSTFVVAEVMRLLAAER